MYTYRIELDVYGDINGAPGARVITYSRGHDREAALRKLGTVRVAQDGTVSDGINPWPGTRSLPAGPITPRSFTEWSVVSIRTVARPGTPRVVAWSRN